MRVIIAALFLSSLLSCTKNRVEKFNNRIVGNWALVEVNTFGLGSSKIVFNGGSFTFNGDNTATYYDRDKNLYYGSWHIDVHTTTETTTNGDGSTSTNTSEEFILTIDVADGNHIKFDQFEIPSFGNANRFKAKVYNSVNVVTYIFERR